MKELLESSQFKKRAPCSLCSAGDTEDEPKQCMACCPDPLPSHQLTPSPPLARQPRIVCITAAC